MDGQPHDAFHAKKKEREIDRSLNTGIYLLRCAELGLSMSDLDQLDMGMIFDMMTERSNDHWDGWAEVAGQDDFNRF